MDSKRRKKKLKCNSCKTTEGKIEKIGAHHFCSDCKESYETGKIDPQSLAKTPKKKHSTKETADKGKRKRRKKSRKKSSDLQKSTDETEIISIPNQNESLNKITEIPDETRPKTPKSPETPTEEIVTKPKEKQKAEKDDDIKQSTFSEIEKSFFKENKFLKSEDKVAELISSLLKCNKDLLNRLEVTNENSHNMMVLHNQVVQELRKIIKDKNDRLELFAENYPDVGDSIFIGKEANNAEEMAEIEEKLIQERADATQWIDKYNEMIAINDNLRKKFESLSLGSSKIEENNGGGGDSEIEDSEEEEYYDEEPDELTKVESPMDNSEDNKKGWFDRWL